MAMATPQHTSSGQTDTNNLLGSCLHNALQDFAAYCPIFKPRAPACTLTHSASSRTHPTNSHRLVGCHWQLLHGRAMWTHVTGASWFWLQAMLSCAAVQVLLCRAQLYSHANNAQREAKSFLALLGADERQCRSGKDKGSSYALQCSIHPDKPGPQCTEQISRARTP